MTLTELKSLILNSDLEEVVNEVILRGESPHFPTNLVAYVQAAVRAKYKLADSDLDIRVVGSAKLGFGLMEKRTKDGLLPRFRPFRPDSDIDLGIISPSLFELIWDDLSAHANNSPWMPRDSGRLGDYMVHGWLRPDHFPKHVRLRRCDDWWDTFSRLSSDRRLGRRAIRGALFHSEEHLRRYQIRGLTECRSALEAGL